MSERHENINADQHGSLDVLAAIERCRRALDDERQSEPGTFDDLEPISGYEPGQLPDYVRYWSSDRFTGSGTFAPVGAVELGRA